MEKKTVTIDGEEFVLDDMSDLQKYMLEQMMDLKTRIHTARMHLDQLKVANAEFTKVLSDSIKLDKQGDDCEKSTK